MWKKKYIFSIYIITILILILGICCSTPSYNTFIHQDNFLKKERIMLQEKSQSVVQVISFYNIILTSSTTTPITKQWGIGGSGVIVKQNHDSTFIMTVGHVCSLLYKEQFTTIFPKIKNFENKEIYFQTLLLLRDNDGKNYLGRRIAIDEKHDICVILSEQIEGKKQLLIEPKKMEDGERIYSFGYPVDSFAPGQVPKFTGILNGSQKGMRNQDILSFSIPSTVGSSGSPIVNFDGRLVSMIHTHLMKFKNISYGVTQEILLEIFNTSVEYYENNPTEVTSIMMELNGFNADLVYQYIENNTR